MKIWNQLFFVSCFLFLFSTANAQNAFFSNEITGAPYSGFSCTTMTEGGNIIAAGRTDTSGNMPYQHGVVVCFDTATGNVRWAKKTDVRDVTIRSVSASKDQIFYMCSFFPSSSPQRGLLLASDTAGNMLWSYYTANAPSDGVDVKTTWDQGCVALSAIVSTHNVGQVSRFTSTGQLLWSTTIRYPLVDQVDAQAIAITQDHHILVTGRVMNIHNMQDIFIVELDEFGNLVWQKCITTNHDLRPSDMVVLQNKDIVITGTYSFVSTFVMCCDSLGNVKWLDNSSLSDFFNSAHVTETPSGNIMLAGNKAYFPELVTISPGGYPLSTREYSEYGGTMSEVCFGAGNRAYAVGMFGNQFNENGFFVKGKEDGYVGCTDRWVNNGLYPMNHSDSLSGYMVIDPLSYSITTIAVQFDTLSLISTPCFADGVINPGVVLHSLEVFPNPTSDHSIISWKNSSDAPIEVLIYDESGKLIRREELISGNNQYVFSRNNLQEGMYHLLFLKNGEYFSSTNISVVSSR